MEEWKLEQSNCTNNVLLNKFDSNFIEIINQFLTDEPTVQKNNIERYFDLFYQESLKQKELFLNSSIQLNKLELKHIVNIQNQVEYLSLNSEITVSEAEELLNNLSKFCDFLTKIQIVKIYYLPPQRNKYPRKYSKNNYPILLEFINYMKMKNYSLTTIHYYTSNVKYFLKYSNYSLEYQNCNKFWFTSINEFETYLNKKVLLEEIYANTAYAYLKAVRLFLKYLFEVQTINFSYKIPLDMIEKGKRKNEYISVQDVLLVLEKIFEQSNDVLRDISIFLIILETGCRPIEVVNLTIHDIYFREKLIVLKSKKSHQRTLAITEPIVTFIQEYFLIRKNYNPKNNSQSIFLSPSGDKMTSQYISQLFRKYNFKAFNEIRFTPKTLRHTFITNALDNENDIDKVQKTVGHKHSISTHYYFYRDINRMKRSFMGKSLYNGG